MIRTGPVAWTAKTLLADLMDLRHCGPVKGPCKARMSGDCRGDGGMRTMAGEGRIRFRCPGCGKSFQVSTQRAGRRAKCLNCGALLRVPPASDPPGPCGKPTAPVRSPHAQMHDPPPPIEPATCGQKLASKASPNESEPLRFTVGARNLLCPVIFREKYMLQIDRRQMTITPLNGTIPLVVPRELAQEMLHFRGRTFKIRGDLKRPRLWSKQYNARRVVSDWIAGKDPKLIPMWTAGRALKDTHPVLRPSSIAVRVDYGLNEVGLLLMACGAGFMQNLPLLGGVIAAGTVVVLLLYLALIGLSKNRAWICALLAILYMASIVSLVWVGVPGAGNAEQVMISGLRWLRISLSGVFLVVHAHSGIRYAMLWGSE